MDRRDFIKATTAAGGAWLLPVNAVDAAETGVSAAQPPAGRFAPTAQVLAAPARSRPLPDLSPAAWIWYPSGRNLQNTFVLFRRELKLAAPPRRAVGWIAADSRYRLEVNGRRIQWGPAPADPRWAEADPLDLTQAFQAGENVIGATVLFYGVGDGTWPIGRPGFLFRLEIEHADGHKETIVSDASWQAQLSYAWPPGQYKRWYLRALQEEFDARLYPYGWTVPGFSPGPEWIAARPLAGSPNRPALSTNSNEYQLQISGGPSDAELRPRSIPLLREELVPVRQLTESCGILWRRSPREYFDVRTPGAFERVSEIPATQDAPGHWTVTLDGQHGAALTFELEHQVVGWPFFTIDAPASTTIELMVQEAHQPGGPPLLNTHFDGWSRFICREGENRFETFDYESCRWIQLHIHGAAGTVRISDVGIRRRVYPWPHQPEIQFAEPALQRLMDASINTLHNCAQETLVDGMGRERQQYSGDCGHQIHAIYTIFGETRQPARYLETYSQGITLDGYFMDCWPAFDRLARIIERELGLTSWGPLLDHSVGFNFDCYYHYLYTGDREALREPYPRLLRFAQYLESIVDLNGLLPVENIGIPSVWLDHQAYQKPHHKQCAFTLYAAAMLEHALAPLCLAFGDKERAQSAREFGAVLQAAAIRAFWDPRRRLFVNNLPWLGDEKKPRCCDRSLANAILFDQCPQNEIAAALRMLTECPAEMGFSYPANAGWRLWALAKGGRADVVLKDLRQRWAAMPSVVLNNTLQEDWHARPDSGAQWSHCAVVPLYITTMSLAGIRPLAPGFTRCEIRPQLADLERLELTAHTVRGPLRFHARGKPGGRTLTLEIPQGCAAELVVRREESLELPPAAGGAPDGYVRRLLPPGRSTTLHLQFS